MKRSKRIQLKAMNSALINHASISSEKVRLTDDEASFIKQNIDADKQYTNVEVIKSSNIYDNMVVFANKTTKQINELKNKETKEG